VPKARYTSVPIMRNVAALHSFQCTDILRESSERSTFVVHPLGGRHMPSHEIDDLESLASNDAPLHTVYSGTRSESVLAARSIIRVSATPSSCTTTRRSDIALLRRSSHRATTGLSPRSAILWSAVADR